MECKYLLIVFVIISGVFNSACTTMVLVSNSMSTEKKLHRPGKEIEKIHVFLKKNRLIVQYLGEKSTFEIEAVYDIKKSIQVRSNNPDILLIKPIKYNKKHHYYKLKNGWKEVPIFLEISDKINKYSHVVDMATNLSLEDYNKYIKRESYEIDAFYSLIKNAKNKNTSITASVMPIVSKDNIIKNRFNRRAVFTDARKGKNISYIMMMPAYEVTSGHSAKAGLILLPITIAIDIITSPIQIPVLIGVSRIGN